MAFDCTMRHGDPFFLDYVPGAGNVAAGSVVLLGNTAGIATGIAHQDIVNNTLGALAGGGGVYDAIGITNIAAYATVYWDVTNHKLTTTSTNNALMGYTLAAMTGANTVVEFFHKPWV